MMPKPRLSSMERRARGSQVLVRCVLRGRDVMGVGCSFVVMAAVAGRGNRSADDAGRNGTACAREGPRTRPGGARWAPGPRATLPAVTASSEVPSSFRSSSVRPGPLALIRIGVTETLSRRRLIAYLVRADLKKTGADTLLGNVWWFLDPCSRCSCTTCWSGIILARGRLEDYPLFIFTAILPWKWFSETVHGGVASSGGRRAPDQADLLPQARAAARRERVGRGVVRLRADPAVRPDGPRLPPPHLGVAAADPARGGGAARVLDGHRDRGVGDQRLLPRRRQHLAARAPVLVLPVADPVQHR